MAKPKHPDDESIETSPDNERAERAIGIKSTVKKAPDPVKGGAKLGPSGSKKFVAMLRGKAKTA
jgi:hypothetical protein